MCRVERGDHRTRRRAEAMQTQTSIQRQNARTEQFRQFTGGGAPQQIHLEESILGMRVAQRARKIVSIDGGQRRYAERIALDRDRCDQSAKRRVSIHGRKTGAEAQPQASDDDHDEAQRRQSCDGQDSFHVNTRRVSPPLQRRS